MMAVKKSFTPPREVSIAVKSMARTSADWIKRLNQMTDKKNRLLYTIITVVSVIGFTVYKMWGCL
jgi:hypothetical protein